METVKVRIQTTIPPFARGISDGYSKIVAAEGAGALFKSLPSLWSRQIPYTMMKCVLLKATSVTDCSDRDLLFSLLLPSWPLTTPCQSLPSTFAIALLSFVRNLLPAGSGKPNWVTSSR